MINKDFTLKTYKLLLSELKKAHYTFYSLERFLTDNNFAEKVVILRHDVDRNPYNALKMAKLEFSMGVLVTYYFREAETKYSWIIKKIASLGHEIGYHYEDLSRTNGDFERAIAMFGINLNKLREFYPVKTICMHGTPFSKWDNRLLWRKYDYKTFGIIGEPYFDIDFNKVLYLTDTGRRWNATNVNVRDKVDASSSYNIKATFDIISALKRKLLPKQIMLTVHPQRWHDNLLLWCTELIWQNVKNVGKISLVKQQR